YERRIGELLEQRLIVGLIQSSVHRRHDSLAEQRPCKRQMEVVAVEVHDVELADALTQMFQLQDRIGQHVFHGRIQPKGLRNRGDELGGGLRVAAREQGNLVALADQLFGQIRYDAFGPAVQPGWNAFDEGCDLRNLHRASLLWVWRANRCES